MRGFGLLLVAGIAVAFACALTAGSAFLVLGDRDGGVFRASLRGAAEILGSPLRLAARITGPAVHGARDHLRAVARAVWGVLAACGRGAGEILSGLRGRLPSRRSPSGAAASHRLPIGRSPSHGGTAAHRGAAAHGGPLPAGPGASPPTPARLAAAVLRRPGRVLALAALLAVLGWVADTQTSVQSDVTKLVPTTMPALRNLNTLEKVTGVSGEIDVTVRGRDVATPATVKWMIGYENQLLTHYGYVEEKGCAKATLCPALSLPDLFSTGSPAGVSTTLTQPVINGLLAAVPSYFSQAVITPDRREATLAFGIRLMPLGRQEQVIDYMRSRLHPPPGVSAALAGLPVLAAEANASLSSSGRRFLTLIASLLAVGLVLLVVLRKVERALIPMTPIVLATGWSSLILFLIGIPLNPMSATLGTLVIAISTEFSVLLSERYRQERSAGHDLSRALARTYRSTGAAVLASGVTAIAGFGVLVFSDITMLRDFGFVTLVDLSVSLAGVLLVLPAVLAVAERGNVLELLKDAPRVASSALARRRRGPRVA